MGLRRLLKNYFYKKKFDITSKKNIGERIERQSILITGANSGIGHELTKKFLSLNNFVLATYNKDCENLNKLSNNNLQICQCDQSKIENIDVIINLIKNKPVNIIINNAGVWGGKNQNFNQIDYDNFVSASNINAISILKFAEVVLKYSKRHSLKSILNISSQYGSTENNTTGRDYVYKGTKSMMNSFSKNLSIDLKRDYGVNVISICPGKVRTKINPGGILDPQNVTLNIIDILDNAETLNGKFINLNKNILTW